ncbi:antitoxin Xre/MbcA/ParS toxin-binding domain-containing protein [Pseudomonas sp. NFACC24-1]|uniref:antitoxin Xre/MbcA/ParS toxin-binding domain-containing protein n=1 Tax=Pseudomonas sp. NFACC24-1 TaxID=1566189 RepID=UPI00147A7B68|nr:antitoxin Xre/MbcA/ParS toxin-binding domain-containing protein [Pseudomonas sp. NFACC24-1]
MIDSGLMASTISALRDMGLLSLETQDRIIPAKALKSKLAIGERLTAGESDYLFRIAHTIALAEYFFGDTEKTIRWLSKPKSRLSGRSPVEMFSTTSGLRQVEALIVQAMEGMSF